MNTFNSYTLLDLPIYLWRYFFSGGLVVILALLLTGLLAKGILNYRKIQKEKLETGGFSIEATKFKPSTKVFVFIAKALDYTISQWITFIHKKAWKPLLKLLDNILPDSLLESIFGLKRNFNERLEFMNKEFPVQQNNFWHHSKRAPDLLRKSPMIVGRWFNGEKVEKYLPFLVSTRSFYLIIKSGILVAFLSFMVLAVIYQPQIYYGYQPASVVHNTKIDYEKRIIDNPTLLPQYRKDIWSTAEFNEIKRDVAKNASLYSAELFNTHNTSEGSKFGWIIYNGYITSLLLALAIGLSFIRYKYYNIFRTLRIPYIKDSHEDFKYELKKSDIESEKRNLSAQNLRATGYDKDSPLITFAVSSGKFEEKGVIGAYRKGDPIFLSARDMSQNTLCHGATGTGKTRSTITVFAQGVFLLKSSYLIAEERFNSLYDTRRNKLTQKAIDLKYLEKYQKLPIPKNVISCGIMDIKSALKDDLLPFAEKLYLQKTFLIVGAKEWKGQLAIDILKDLNPVKLIGFLKSMNAQMGSEDNGDFWSETALQWVQRFAYVAYGFSRTDKGIIFMEQRHIKPWSLAFLYELICLDPNNELLAHCINAISETLEKQPERLADIFNQNMINALNALLNEWINLDEAKETKLGVQINLSKVMSSYSNSDLKAFLTGVSSNLCEVGDLWNRIVAFDLNVDDYGAPGKMILIFLKNLMFEEAVKRQIRFSNRLVDITRYFRERYPDLLVLETSPESIPQNLLDMNDINRGLSDDAKLRDDFITLAFDIQGIIGVEEDWERGTYLTKMRSILSNKPERSLDIVTGDYHPEVYELCQQAISLATELFSRNPRFEEQLGGMVEIDPTIFNADENDNKEVAQQKRESLEIYYEYEELKNRLDREHFWFFGDEYQELISIDKTGACYTDSNFPNISRSTNFKLFVATQTKAAFVMKVGQEVLDNFSSQFRTRIYLTNEDKETLLEMESLAGEADVFINPNKNRNLLNMGHEEENYTIYNNFNALISEAVYENNHNEVKSEAYPYEIDIFAEAEPIDIKFSDFSFDRPFSSIFDIRKDFSIPSLKNHFLSIDDISEYEERGSSLTEISSNEEQIRQAWRHAKQSASDKYDAYLEKGYQNDVKILPVSDITALGNLHGVIFVQRAGVTRKDHIILAPVGDYIAQN